MHRAPDEQETATQPADRTAERISHAFVQHDWHDGGLQASRAPDQQIVRSRRVRLDPIAAATQSAAVGEHHADACAPRVECGFTISALHVRIASAWEPSEVRNLWELFSRKNVLLSYPPCHPFPASIVLRCPPGFLSAIQDVPLSSTVRTIFPATSPRSSIEWALAASRSGTLHATLGSKRPSSALSKNPASVARYQSGCARG